MYIPVRAVDSACWNTWATLHVIEHTESRSHSFSDVRTERNNAALHTAEIAVASHRAAETDLFDAFAENQ
jgi:hypothetical protein